MARRRYRFNEETKEMEEIGQDWTDTERRAATPTEELTYGGLQAVDGTPINSRRKYREYMHSRGLTTASDYTETWSKAKGERESFYQAKGYDSASRREAVARAAYQLENRRRKK